MVEPTAVTVEEPVTASADESETGSQTVALPNEGSCVLVYCGCTGKWHLGKVVAVNLDEGSVLVDCFEEDEEDDGLCWESPTDDPDGFVVLGGQAAIEAEEAESTGDKLSDCQKVRLRSAVESVEDVNDSEDEDDEVPIKILAIRDFKPVVDFSMTGSPPNELQIMVRQHAIDLFETGKLTLEHLISTDPNTQARVFNDCSKTVMKKQGDVTVKCGHCCGGCHCKGEVREEGWNQHSANLRSFRAWMSKQAECYEKWQEAAGLDCQLEDLECWKHKEARIAKTHKKAGLWGEKWSQRDHVACLILHELSCRLICGPAGVPRVDFDTRKNEEFADPKDHWKNRLKMNVENGTFNDCRSDFKDHKKAFESFESLRTKKHSTKCPEDKAREIAAEILVQCQDIIEKEFGIKFKNFDMREFVDKNLTVEKLHRKLRDEDFKDEKSPISNVEARRAKWRSATNGLTVARQLVKSLMEGKIAVNELKDGSLSCIARVPKKTRRDHCTGKSRQEFNDWSKCPQEFTSDGYYFVDMFSCEVHDTNCDERFGVPFLERGHYIRRVVVNSLEFRNVTHWRVKIRPFAGAEPKQIALHQLMLLTAEHLKWGHAHDDEIGRLLKIDFGGDADLFGDNFDIGDLPKEKADSSGFDCRFDAYEKHPLFKFDERPYSNPKTSGTLSDTSQRCDGDHLVGRRCKWMNNPLFCVLTSHQSNTVASVVRRDDAGGNWCFMFVDIPYEGAD